MKTTKKGKAIAPVVDIFPQLAVGFHDQERVAEELRLLKSFGFDRVYFVLCNPGYPTFSNPILSIQPPDVPGFENYSFKSLIALGDPNFAYVHECHKLGMEAFAIIKPYEGGGGSTVPHGAKVVYDMPRVETIGGERVGFDALLSRRPDLAVQRKPDPAAAARAMAPVRAITVRFCLEAVADLEGPFTECDTAPCDIRLLTSADNGTYRPYDGPLTVAEEIREEIVRDSNGFPLQERPARCRVFTLSGLNIPPSIRYFAVVVNSANRLHTLPQSMITLEGQDGPLPATVTSYIRRGGNTVENLKPAAGRTWGMEQIARPIDDPAAAEAELREWGFEFEWYGSGFRGSGWKSAGAYGIARGHLATMKGTPCEAYPEVRSYWLDWVKTCIEMGFDGVDIRLQNHSGMVSDYANYGFNAPLVEAYQARHGVDILTEPHDPLKLMALRGEFFVDFVQEAARELQRAGRKLQIHLRHCHAQPRLSADINELGFWAMPKIWFQDWKALVDLADEVTLKDYHFNAYDPALAREIKEYAAQRGKRVWTHCYVSQGRELNEEFLNAVDADPGVAGILIYEVAHSETNEINYGLIEQYREVGLNEPAARILRDFLNQSGYQ